MDDRSPHPYDELQVDKFPFDEKEFCLRGRDENIHRTGILNIKNSNKIHTSNTSVRKRQQQYQQQHPQLDRPHVYFQTAESMKALYMANKSSYTTASYLYPDSTVATMETADTSPPVYSQLSFLQTPTHGRHAPYAVYAQPPNKHHQEHQQLDRPHVYFQTAESMKALYVEKKSPHTTASYLYPDSTIATIEAAAAVAAATSPSVYSQLSFLQTPTHGRHAPYDVYAQPPNVNKQIDGGLDAPRAKEAAPASTEKPTSPSLPPITNLLHELTPDWRQYFDLSQKDDYVEATPSQALSSKQAFFTSAKPTEPRRPSSSSFPGGDKDSFVPPEPAKPTEPRRPSSSSPGVHELSPIWLRYLDLSQLSSTCQGGQLHHRDHPWCVDDACTAQSDQETKRQNKHQHEAGSNKDFLPANVPPKVITVKPDLPKIITVAPNTAPPGNMSVYPPQLITTEETMLTTSTTMMTTSLTQTTTNHANTTHMTTWTSPQTHESQPPAWSCPYAPTPSPLYVVPMSRPTRSIPTTTTTTTTTTTPMTSSGHRRRGSSSQPQRLDWSHRLDMPLIDAVAAAAAAAANNTQNESFTSDAAAHNATSTMMVHHRRPSLPSSSLDIVAPTRLSTATWSSLTSSSSSSSVQVIGPPHLRIYKVSLQAHLLASLNPIIQKAEDYARSRPRGWKTNLFSSNNKQELPVFDIPNAFDEIQGICQAVSERIRLLYRPQAGQVYMDPRQQPHLLKYSVVDDDDFCGGGGGGGGGRLHHDPCDVTASLMLSSSSEYAGGGIYLDDCQTTVHLEQGEFLLHPGSLAHAGQDISSGTCYLMVFFCHLR